MLNIVLILLGFLVIAVIVLVVTTLSWKHYNDRTRSQKYLKKLMKGYVIDNVIVTKGFTTSGKCGQKLSKGQTVNIKEAGKTEDVIVEYDVPNVGNFILVPVFMFDNCCDWTFYVWLHEIGHIHHKHYDKFNRKDSYIYEYQAEMFALHHFKKSKIFSNEEYVKCIDHAKEYITKHMKESARNYDLQPNEISNFIISFIGWDNWIEVRDIWVEESKIKEENAKIGIDQILKQYAL